MWVTINVLKNPPKISNRTKRHHKQINFFDINEKLEKKFFRPGFIIVLGTLTRWFTNGVVKQEF